MPPALRRQDERARAPVPAWKSAIMRSRAAAGQPAVVALDGQPGALGEVLGQALAPLGEVGEDQHPLVGGEDGLDDLLESAELAGAIG